MQSERLQKYADLLREKRAAESKLNAVTKELAELMPSILEEFASDGVQNVKLTSGVTLYLRRQLWARPKSGLAEEMGLPDGSDMALACEGLRKIGLGEFVKDSFNVHSLSAYVREHDAGDEPLPEGFDNYVTIAEEFKILGAGLGKGKGEED